MAPAVTPAGVRDGDPAALAGLCAARGPSVLAYCRHVAGDAAAGAAAADAFGRFRAAVVTTGDLRELDPEALLIAATRSAAASHAERSADRACAEIPALLAARANRTFALGDVERLEAHLETCPACRAPVERFEAAERAYRDPPGPAMDPLVVAQIIVAMAAAAPMHAATRPAPARNGHSHDTSPPEPPVAAATAPESPVDEPTTELRALDAGLAGPPAAAPPAPEPAAAPEPQAVAPEPEPVAPDPGPPAVPVARAPEPAPPPAEPDARQPVPQPLATNSRIGRRPARKGRARSVGGAFGLSARSEKLAPPPRPDEPEQAPARKPRTRRRLRSGAAGPAAMGAPLPRARRPAPKPATAPRLTRARGRAGGRSRRRHRLPVLLPVAVVFAALLVALFVSGVVGGSDPASSPRVDMPAQTPPAETTPADVVVVPGADEVEEAKSRERERARRRRQAAATETRRDSTSRPEAAATAPAPVVAPPLPPPPAQPQRSDDGDRTRSREIEPGNGATGSEQIPPPEDTSTVPDLAPPPESATAP